MTEVSIEHAAAYIGDKASLYEILAYNQYIMPPLKDPFITSKLLAGIVAGKIWMLKDEYVHIIKTCPHPPSKKALAQILHDIMISYDTQNAQMNIGLQACAALILKTPPCSQWQLQVLA